MTLSFSTVIKFLTLREVQERKKKRMKRNGRPEVYIHRGKEG